MGQEEMKTAAKSILAGPALVTIRCVSPRGPLARASGRLSIPPTQISIVDLGKGPQTIMQPTVDPLQVADTGIMANARLTAALVGQERVEGNSGQILLSGTVPAIAGAYISTLRLATKDGVHLDIPLNFRVVASASWGFGCMLLGLLCVWLMSALDTETGIQGDLHRALAARKEVRELLPQQLPPQSRLPVIEHLNREFDAAINILQGPRTLAFVDHRPTDAKEHLDLAIQMTTELRKELASGPPGSLEVADLVKEWEREKEEFAKIVPHFLAAPPQGDPLAHRLLAFDAWAAQRILQVPVAYYTREFDLHVNRVWLLFATGRAQDAAAEAVVVRRWMQRAAEVVNAQARLMTYLTETTASNQMVAERVRRRVEAAGLSLERRTVILGMLDKAVTTLAEPFGWSARRMANKLILEAWTETLRAEKDLVLKAVETVQAQEEKEDALDGINAILAEGADLKRNTEGKIDPQQKIKWLQRGVAAWRTRLATFPEPAPTAMHSALDQFEQAVNAGDLAAVSNHLKELFEQWRVYSTERAKKMIGTSTAPFCMRMREDALMDIQALQSGMRRLGGHPRLQQWEGELDLMRMRIHQSPDTIENMPGDCVNGLGEISTKTHNLSVEVNSALWDAFLLPDTTRRQLASDLGESLTPATMQNLLSEVRPLHIEISTGGDDCYVGREIGFRIDNLDPVWGPGVTLLLDFGDGTRAMENVEEFRKNKGFFHVYNKAQTFKLTIAATEMLPSKSGEATARRLGEGQLAALSIAQSPLSAARHLADIFFNARFGLALTIAGLLYFWRYTASKAIFGASTFDYAQAFALGFTVSLAVNDLPQKLVEFIK